MPGHADYRLSQANPARVVLFGIGGFICLPLWLSLIWSADYVPAYDVQPARGCAQPCPTTSAPFAAPAPAGPAPPPTS